MRVLELTLDYPPIHHWGMGVHVYHLASALTKCGCDIVVGTRNPRRRRDRYQDASDLRVFRSSLQAERALADPGGRDWAKSFDAVLEYNRLFHSELAEWLHAQRWHPEVIHNHGWTTFPAAAELRREFSVPVVSTIHFLDAQYGLIGIREQFPGREIAVAQEQRMITDSEHLISVSAACDRLLRSAYSNAVPSTVIPNGIPIPVAGLSGSTPATKSHITVLFVGRLAWEKGAYALPAIAQVVRARRTDVRFVVVGDGGMHQLLARETRSLRDIFRLTGRQPNAAVLELYRAADILLVPSMTELAPLVVLEGMAAGLAVVATAAEGPVDMIDHGVNGELVPFRVTDGLREPDAEGLAAAIVRLAEDDAYRSRLGQAARDKASQQWSANRMAQRTYEVLRREAGAWTPSRP